MPIFKCDECGCVENTALSGYWWRKSNGKDKALCSECDPKIGKWHGVFEKMPATEFYLGNDGFLYHEDEVMSDSLNWRKEHQRFKILGPANDT